MKANEIVPRLVTAVALGAVILSAIVAANAQQSQTPPAKLLSGTMTNIEAGQEIEGGRADASSVSISIKLSADGTAIAKITFSVGETKWTIKSDTAITTGTSTGEHLYLNGPITIRNHRFETKAAAGAVSASGRFASPFEAQGAAHLYSVEFVGNRIYTLDLGEWQWKASTK